MESIDHFFEERRRYHYPRRRFAGYHEHGTVRIRFEREAISRTIRNDEREVQMLFSFKEVI